MLGEDGVAVSSALAAVEAVEGRLMGLLGKTTEAVGEEAAAADAIAARLAHLNRHLAEGLSSAEGEDWRRQRVDRLIIEYLLRAGRYQSAIALAKRTNLEYMANLDVFLTAQEVPFLPLLPPLLVN